MRWNKYINTIYKIVVQGLAAIQFIHETSRYT